MIDCVFCFFGFLSLSEEQFTCLHLLWFTLQVYGRVFELGFIGSFSSVADMWWEVEKVSTAFRLQVCWSTTSDGAVALLKRSHQHTGNSSTWTLSQPKLVINQDHSGWKRVILSCSLRMITNKLKLRWSDICAAGHCVEAWRSWVWVCACTLTATSACTCVCLSDQGHALLWVAQPQGPAGTAW